MECYCYLRNIQDRLCDGKTPFERRFDEPCKGPIIPFGSLVECLPISQKISHDSINWERKCSREYSRLCMYAGESSKETYWLWTLEELEEMDASEIHANRLNAKEVILLKKW